MEYLKKLWADAKRSLTMAWAAVVGFVSAAYVAVLTLAVTLDLTALKAQLAEAGVTGPWLAGIGIAFALITALARMRSLGKGG